MEVKMIKIRINTIQELKNFVELTNKIPNIIDLSCGRYSVDGKSIMGVMSFNLNRPIILSVYGDLNQSFEYELRKFEVL